VFAAGPGWEWTFFINIPVGVLVAVALPVLVDARRPATRTPRVDVPGAVIATGAIGSLIYGLVRAGDTGFTEPVTLLALGAGAALLVVFVAVERAVAAPLIRVAAKARRPVAAGNLVMMGASGLLLADFFLASQYLQHVLKLSPLTTGLLFLPVALVIGLGTHAGMRVIGRLGGRPAAVSGFVLAGTGALMLAQVPAAGNAWAHVLPGFAVAGLGLGATFVTATTTAMAHVDAGEAGMASGLINTGHELGATLGVAFVSSVAASSLGAGSASAVPVGGYGAAFTAAAVVAAVLAVLSGWLMPAGRPPVTDRPVFAH
jgi:MFS family permease